MKFSTMIVGAFAAVAATAAPVKEEAKRGQFDSFNNFAFQNQDLLYLSLIQNFDGGFGGIQNLILNQGLNFDAFGGLFNSQAFGLDQILQLQTIALIESFSNQGLFQGVNLGNLDTGLLNLGLISNLGNLGLDSFIDSGLNSQIAAVISQNQGKS